MVPVINEKGECLFPTKERRARRLMERNEAKPYFQKGIFCIRLVRAETEKREEYPRIILGIDTGSKREGYTVATAKSVVLNITTNTPYWVKKHIEVRKNLRRNRRYRKTPYRACRENRAVLRKENKIPPSTKARWDAKLRIIKLLSHILPITDINIEDIQARTIKVKDRRNTSFSPLEVGKKYFDEQIATLYPAIILHKTSGRYTKTHRDKRGFNKSRSKLDYIWEAHNVDSHSLVEMILQKDIRPYLGLYKIEFLEYHRRQLHIQNYQKGHIRKPYGTTVSAGMSRGSVLKYKDKFYYLGGESKEKVAIHSIITGKRIKQHTPITDIKRLYTSSWRTQFVPRINPWASLRNYL